MNNDTNSRTVAPGILAAPYFVTGGKQMTTEIEKLVKAAMLDAWNEICLIFLVVLVFASLFV